MFLSVVPAIRTIPGVEEFDYAIDESTDVRVGDVLRIPFRKQQLPALVMERKSTSPFAAKAVTLTTPPVLLRLGAPAAELLRQSARRTFTSQPSVFDAWIRTVPKRVTPIASPEIPRLPQASPEREIRFLVRRWHDARGLLPTARTRSGRTLILTPWKHRADLLAQELGGVALHADIADGAAWTAIRRFHDQPSSILATTRLGGWISCLADTVLIDEPENDDFKQDELSPRIDTRWLLDMCATIRPELSVITFGVTPRLSTAPTEWPHAALIELELATEPRLWRGLSEIEGLSARAVQEIHQAIDARMPVTIIHAVQGDRARVSCRDCGWNANCAACGFPLSSIGSTGLCRKCGRKQPLPEGCPSCGGFDLARSSVGRDKLAETCRINFQSPLIRVITTAELQTHALPRHGLVVLTDVSLLGGMIEDTRRRERLLIAWRRLASAFAASGSRVLAQGSEESLADCRQWLSWEGVAQTWRQEIAERAVFHYPPAARMAKLLVDGTELEAQSVMDDLSAQIPDAWQVNGPYPVAYRSVTRTPRFVVQLIAPIETPETTLIDLLNRFKTRAIIDLDPIAFFA